ncbi:MAG: transcriptional regulator GcvA [Pseudomonadales bacterium]
MTQELPPLNSLRAFNAVVKYMSFQRAAESLFVTPAALSYQVKQLEQFMGVKLFKRLNRAIELTEQGRMLAPGVEQGFEVLAHSVKLAMRQPNSDVLVISAGPAFTSRWLAPRLYRFIAQYPHIDVRISATMQVSNLADGDVDIAVRYGRGEYPKCRSDKLLDEYVVPLCNPQLLKGETAMSLSSLMQQTLIYDDTPIAHDFFLTAWPQWFEALGINGFSPKRKGLHFNVTEHALNAAVTGAGVVLGRAALAQSDLESGRLVIPFDHKIKQPHAFFSVVLEGRVEEPHIAAFRQWLFDEVHGEVDMSTPGTLV